MLQKETSQADTALFDAILAFFANTRPSSGTFSKGQSAAAPAPSAAAKREGTEQLADATRLVVAILGVLTLISALLVALDLQAIKAVLVEQGWRSPSYRIAIVILVLLVVETLLIGAVSVQDRRRRQVEALLRESEDRIAFAAEAASQGLWRWDAASDSFWSTDHCNRILGIPLNAQYSINAVLEAVHPDDRPKVADALRHGAESGATFEIELRLALGTRWRWVRVRARPLKGADGKIVQIAGTIVDISDSVALRAENEKQQQSLTHLTRVGVVGELSGALAHELNQPLTAILSNAQAVQRMIGHEPIDMVELKSAISDIIDDDARAGEVIRHLRTLLKKGESHAEIVEVNAMIEKVLALARNDLTGRHIVAATLLCEAPLAVSGDAVQLQQLLLNLILNAADAMAEDGQSGGVLQVISDEEDEFVHISVSDTGPGIRSEVMERLFEPFNSTKKQGLGLGLSISRSIATGHGGTIWAENNSRRGATFHVSLPRARGVV